ncbi:uncharacterized protein EV420DRAFT_1638677 [Desarmillaria tabescens]|uniref:Uncharacterized protein n=1 Tax=Armillaria tabescens TaxID=1929756 RepID=A0AA39NDS0_ARMTA|nr:uncharacterized protein EV420DRAFT_1638677 [Desarmillaria tabescens]KAK0463757.1 hypothetical protein EV420DRAFT_1638677 [Desarmillaria tabescens]
MSKFAILSAFVLLCAQLPGGLASPAMVKRQGHEQGPVDPPAAPTKPIQARQAVVTSVVGGVTSVVGGVTTVVGGVTSIVGGILADEPVATATTVLDRRDGVAISVGGDITFDGHFTVDTDAAASKAVEAQVAAVTSIVGGVTSVVGGVTSIIGGILADESTAAPSATAIASKAVEARQAVVTTVINGMTSVIGVLGDESTAAPVATASAVVEARDTIAISVGGDINFDGHFTVDTETAASKVIDAREVVATTVPVVDTTVPVGRDLVDASVSAAVPVATAELEARQNAIAGPFGGDFPIDTEGAASKVVEARQVVATTVPVGRDLVDASVSAAVPVATAELEARQGVVISVGGGVAGANFGGLFTVQSSALPAAKTVEADVAAVTSVVGGVTSVVGGVTTVIGGVTSVLGRAVPTPPAQH